jgi:hypothetical protein
MAATMELAFVISGASAQGVGSLFEIISDGRGRVDSGGRGSVPFWDERGYTPHIFQRVRKMLI